jgi:hypothetical protein
MLIQILVVRFLTQGVIAESKEKPIWVFVVIDVWSRLWPSTVVGKRSYCNTSGLSLRDLSKRMNLEVTPLTTTEGFRFYERVIRRVFGPACLQSGRVSVEMTAKSCPVRSRSVLINVRTLSGVTGAVRQRLDEMPDRQSLRIATFEGSRWRLRRTRRPMGFQL